MVVGVGFFVVEIGFLVVVGFLVVFGFFVVGLGFGMVVVVEEGF